MKKLLIIFLFFTSVLSAQTSYYVDNTGVGDTLATITEVNALELEPGDSILFKRGCTWTVTTTGNALNIDDYSGTVTDSIFYDAYGAGVKPIITGRQSVTGWNVAENWTNTSGNIWRMSTDMLSNTYDQNDRGRLWLNGVEAQKEENITTPTASLPWTHNGQLLYVYSVGNPAGVFSNIESIGTVNYNLLLTESYVSIRNIDFRGSGHGMIINGASHLTIEDCNIGRDVGVTGVYVLHTTNVVFKNNTLDTYDTFYDLYDYLENTEDGIHLIDGCSNWNIHNNTFKNWGHSGFTLQLNNAAYSITNIKFHNNYLTSPDIDYGRGVLYNITALGFGNCTGNEYYNNYIYNTAISNQISGDGLKFYNNIIDYVDGSPYDANFGVGLILSSYLGVVKNNEIYNNLIINCIDDGFSMGVSSNYDVEDNLIINNVFAFNGGYQIRYTNSSGGHQLENTFQNNLLYKSGSNDVVFYEKANNTTLDRIMTVVEFNDVSGDVSELVGGSIADVITNNIGGDPLFVDPDNADYLLRDYNLSEGSPAIAAGLGVGLTLDYAGNAWAETPSIGALEYDSDPPDPPGLPEVTTTEITSYTVRYATGAGNVTSDGGGTITSRGVCWSTSANPTTASSKFTSGGTTGVFSGRLYPLKANTTYHYRSFAVNESGTSYGADQTFTTPVQSVNTTGGKYLYHNGKLIISK